MKRDIAFNLQSVFLLLNCIICKAVMNFITAYLVFLYEQPWVTVHQHNRYYTAISETDKIHMMYRILFLCHSCCCVLPQIPKRILWRCLPILLTNQNHTTNVLPQQLCMEGGFTKDATLCTSIDALEKARKPQLILSHFSALSTLGP